MVCGTRRGGNDTAFNPTQPPSTADRGISVLLSDGCTAGNDNEDREDGAHDVVDSAPSGLLGSLGSAPCKPLRVGLGGRLTAHFLASLSATLFFRHVPVLWS